MKSVAAGIVGMALAIVAGQKYGLYAFIGLGLATCFLLAYLEQEKEDRKDD